MKPARLLAAASLLAMIGATVSGAHANDSMAEVAVGGLVLTESPEISLDREDLFISREEVRVDYRFTNTGPDDIEALVAFPLPDQDVLAVTEPTYDLSKELDFRTTVDGKPVKYQIVLQAILGVEDVTSRIAELGLQPNTPFIWDDYLARIKALPSATLAAAEAAGLLALSGSTGEEIYEPQWKLRTIVTRTQVFPAGKSIAVSHRYKPIAGGSVPGAYDAVNRHEDWVADRISTYCIEDSWFRAFDKASARHPVTENNPAPYMEYWLGYVLSSGANWQGPIKDFRLVIDKGKPDNLVSFCANGVKKISPTQFEVHKTNFEPKDDLKILIVEWNPPD